MATYKLDLESAVSKLIESQEGDILRTALSGFLDYDYKKEDYKKVKELPLTR